MRLSVLSAENRLFHVECSGTIVLTDVQLHNPLDMLLGPNWFASTILLNLSEATMIDTAAVSWFIQCHKACQEAGGCLVLHSIPPMVEQLLHLLRMQKVLHLAVNEKEARVLAQGVVR